ncbi:MAG: imidazoleglycerol-phosphate dehydratase HisB [Oscillospiraceae bacterium]|nr:imidazoleglycerol-phosphate dehydratase HisB [Oscillospiraceae bacterium]
MRASNVSRKTKETDVQVMLDLDKSASPEISTGIGFFDHMLTALGVHSGFTLYVRCKGDLEVDGHHTVEDVGIALGQAFAEAVGDRAGIARYGSKYIPMDEALAFCALDVSGRPFLRFGADFPQETAGDFDSCLAAEFFRAFACNAGLTLHLKAECGDNTHHMIEAMFKALAHALREAAEVVSDGVLSSKGVL